MKTLIFVLALLSLGACSHKERFTGSQNEQAFCHEHPDQCVMRANDNNLKVVVPNAN